MTFPRTKGLLGLAVDGYDFISNRCDERDTDVFETRLGGVLPVTCMRGAAAAEVLYSDRLERAGAMPGRIQKTLLGQGGVQVLDGDAHRHRKELFLSLMTPGALAALTERAETEWRTTGGRWERQQRPVVLLDEAARILCRSVCDWSGVPLPEHDLDHRTTQLRRLFESPAKLGPAHWRGRTARKQVNAWAGGLIDDVRAGRIDVPEERALHPIAWHRDLEGNLLDTRVAAVELINVLRPTVAIAYYVVFVAAALHAHPQWRERLRHDDTAVEWFVHEVRRHYPFFPAVTAKVRTPFDWSGIHFPAGRLVLLDLYGTNHHPARWPDRDRFDPERFRHWDATPFDFIPQGAGHHNIGHRCAGEWITIEQMKLIVRVLTRTLDYSVPNQDLRISHRRAPTQPNSGFVLADVRITG